MRSTEFGTVWSPSPSASFAQRPVRTSSSAIEPERPRTTLADLPGQVRSWLHGQLGDAVEIVPVDQLVNTHSSFRYATGNATFFVKVLRRPDASIRLEREVSALTALSHSRLPVPQLVAHHAFDTDYAVLVTGWLDAMPARYLDFHGRRSLRYLEQLGALLAAFHRISEKWSLDFDKPLSGFSATPAPEALDRATDHYFGAADADLFQRHHEAASAWLATTAHQVIHGDLQDKNILLNCAEEPAICDFEAVCTASVAFDLSVDRIYLKRALPESERSALQQALLSGYGANRHLLDPAPAALLRLLRLGQLAVWRFPEPDPGLRPAFANILPHI